MSCFQPRTVWQSTMAQVHGPHFHVDTYTGELSERRFPILFSQPADLDAYRVLRVPCGSCVGCRGDRSREWSIRSFHESLTAPQSCFLTLTYRDPPAEFSIRDLQLFVKRLRKHTDIRYLACAEYGDLYGRPHYHALVFGSDFLGGAQYLDDQLYTSDFLTSIWPHGFVSAGSLTMSSCCYVAGYVMKKNGRESKAVMSRRPGLGRAFCDKYVDDFVRTGITVIDGREYPIPHRYFEWASADLAQVKRDRVALMESKASKSFAEEVEQGKALAAKALKASYKLRNRQHG